MNYKYQGQELNESLGYNMYEFELRHYDATIGRFVTTDPYEQFHSPYLAMGNNPITSFDPDGGYCYDSNGNQIACPDDDIYDDYRGKNQHIDILDDVLVTASSGSSTSQASTGAISAGVAGTVALSEITAGTITLPTAGTVAGGATATGGVAMGLIPLAMLAYLAENPPPRPSYENLRSDPFFPITTQPSPGSSHYTQTYEPLSLPPGININSYIPPPKTLPGFPGAVKVKRKNERARWHLPNGDIGEWDSQHGEVEVYDKTGKKHKGGYDPDTGEQKSEPKKGRRTDKK